MPFYFSFLFTIQQCPTYLPQYSSTWLVPFDEEWCAYVHFGSVVLQCYPLHFLAAYYSVLPIQLTMTNPYYGSIIIKLCTVVSYMLIPILLKMIKNIFFCNYVLWNSIVWKSTCSRLELDLDLSSYLLPLTQIHRIKNLYKPEYCFKLCFHQYLMLINKTLQKGSSCFVISANRTAEHFIGVHFSLFFLLENI